MVYGKRLAIALREIVLITRKDGPGAAYNWAKRRAFNVTESLLVVRSGPFPAPTVPGDVRIVAITPADAEAKQQDAVTGGAGPEVLNFQRGAVCYVAYVGDEPAGVGWRFPDSRLLRRLGFDDRAVYVGGFFVRPRYRGRNLYPLLLEHIGSDSLRSDQLAFAEVSERNVASIRGLRKVGFRLAGKLRLISVAGVIVSCRLTAGPATW